MPLIDYLLNIPVKCSQRTSGLTIHERSLPSNAFSRLPLERGLHKHARDFVQPDVFTGNRMIAGRWHRDEFLF